MSRIVVVTGAARGIGAAIASAFAERGDEVLALDVGEPQEPADGVRYLRADVSDPESVAQAFAGLERVDVLVNNAGIQRVGLVGRRPIEEWLGVIGNASYITGHALVVDGGWTVQGISDAREWLSS